MTEHADTRPCGRQHSPVKNLPPWPATYPSTAACCIPGRLALHAVPSRSAQGARQPSPGCFQAASSWRLLLLCTAAARHGDATHKDTTNALQVAQSSRWCDLGPDWATGPHTHSRNARDACGGRLANLPHVQAKVAPRCCWHATHYRPQYTALRLAIHLISRIHSSVWPLAEVQWQGAALRGCRSVFCWGGEARLSLHTTSFKTAFFQGPYIHKKNVNNKISGLSLQRSNDNPNTTVWQPNVNSNQSATRTAKKVSATPVNMTLPLQTYVQLCKWHSNRTWPLRKTHGNAVQPEHS